MVKRLKQPGELQRSKPIPNSALQRRAIWMPAVNAWTRTRHRFKHRLIVQRLILKQRVSKDSSRSFAVTLAHPRAHVYLAPLATQLPT